MDYFRPQPPRELEFDTDTSDRMILGFGLIFFAGLRRTRIRRIRGVRMRQREVQTQPWPFGKYHGAFDGARAFELIAHPDNRCAVKPRDSAAPSRIMTAVEVAKFLRINPATLYKLVRQHQIPAFKIGTEYRFYSDEIEKWMADQQIRS